MANNKVFLSLPRLSGNEQKYIQKALGDNWITSGGPNVDDFENDLEEYLGDGISVAALNSGTSAIHLALILLKVEAGDEVICQSMTFSASANPILYQGATPVFVDSEPDTWNICPEHLEIAIKERIAKGKKPKAIIAVHLYGMPYKVDEIQVVADRYEISVIEDSAEALGSSYKGKKCGTFGDFGVFSFNGNKIITTSSGGALISRSKRLKEKAIFYATQSRDEAIHYQHSEVGYNYRMSNVCAGIGRGQMEILDSNLDAKRQIHDFYVNLFKDIKEITVFENPSLEYDSNYWLNTILIEPSQKVTRDVLLQAFEKANIESRPLWKPMHLQPLFCDYPFYGNEVSNDLFRKGLCLPSGVNLNDQEKGRIKRVIDKLCEVA
ncbi:aminotransferase class I/II-fold pyridoxal phosphate-dependent enzyme [Flavobacterium sp. Fl-318]|uniref:Aminotransferase class I/II-fold pyridoxal phosphate-dependent enzyme n=1 Tax=Flavobacterium cupriresistens TaxID=2893885 RepID=A0ABU4RBZ8_9FLAO|nr:MULTISPECIES: aminotransferase class I/II-fold pyridoxal phosphate-dependent enzyme [unclassified Flavobacterium]MDX6190107.1 aminotransferase class I/II-fold pyridoxal phosphate-dependent enzyme [Flavobacterium sp. Fl-318]UFH44967.1 aminotransferase class I/II-fold pyridoxal phosphate-dependent enzyme [Flavobacterium sp. F-323]